MSDKILQIVPASGWRAVYKDHDGSEFSAPLVLWALLEDSDGRTYITGVGTDAEGVVEPVDLDSHFLRFERDET